MKCRRCDFDGLAGTFCPRCGAEQDSSTSAVQLAKQATPPPQDTSLSAIPTPLAGSSRQSASSSASPTFPVADWKAGANKPPGITPCLPAERLDTPRAGGPRNGRHRAVFGVLAAGVLLAVVLSIVVTSLPSSAGRSKVAINPVAETSTPAAVRTGTGNVSPSGGTRSGGTTDPSAGTTGSSSLGSGTNGGRTDGGTSSPTTVGSVQVDPSDSLSQAVAQSLDTYFSGINSGDYASAWGQLTTAQQNQIGEFNSFSQQLSTSSNSAIELHSTTANGDGSISADVTFTSHQDGSLGVNPGETCTDWTLTYRLLSDGNGGYLIGGVPSADHSAC